MSRKILLLCVTAVSIISFSSCKKEGHRRNGNMYNEAPAVINVVIKSGDVYKLNTSQYGNGTASITKQATAFSVSEITYDGMNGGYIYKYITTGGAKAGKSANDQVMLKVTNESTGGGGCRGGYESGFTKSERTVTINMTLE
jgi:hypothetical protein